MRFLIHNTWMGNGKVRAEASTACVQKCTWQCKGRALRKNP